MTDLTGESSECRTVPVRASASGAAIHHFGGALVGDCSGLLSINGMEIGLLSDIIIMSVKTETVARLAQ